MKRLTEEQRIHRRFVRQQHRPRPQPCEICGDMPAECHHIDYADPERVMWLCTAHHRQTHSQFGKPAPVDWMADIRVAVRRIEAHRRAVARPAPEASE